MAGAVAKIARTSSLGTARRRLIGIIRASGSPLSVRVYDRPCLRPRVTEPESATNWRTLTSVERSSGVAIAEVYMGVPRRTTAVFELASVATLNLVSSGRDLRTSWTMDCVFCRLIRDDTATWIARGPSTCAFAPLTPIAPGHTLVVPTAHVTDIFDASPHVLAQSMALVRRVADAMRSALGAEGVNILNASGPSSEQSVLHLHFHVIPRWGGDNFSTWPTSRSEHHVEGDSSSRLASALAVERAV